MVQALAQAQEEWDRQEPEPPFIPSEIVYSQPEPIPEVQYTKELEPVADIATPVVDPDEALDASTLEEPKLHEVLADQPIPLPEGGEDYVPTIDTRQEMAPEASKLAPDGEIAPETRVATQKRRSAERAQNRKDEEAA